MDILGNNICKKESLGYLLLQTILYFVIKLI